MKLVYLLLSGSIKKIKKMNRLSSNSTLMLKLFIPIFWIVFFGAFAFASYVANPIEAPQIANKTFRIQSTIFVAIGIIFFALTFFRLKRVDADDKYIYISNYFKTYRYPTDTIDSIVIYNHLVLKAAHLTFKGRSSFGKKVIFIPYMINLNEFAEKHNVSLSWYGKNVKES